ncbi:MAG: hypothetical protein ABI787_08770 [Spartobacteria bacterium]
MVRGIREKMKTIAFIFSGTLLALTTVLAKDDLPKAESFAHYEPMVKRSPFAVASAAGPVGGTPDFARNLYVANAAHSTDGDYVTIASTTDKNLKEYLNSKDSVSGYTISNIQWSDRVGETKVTIAKDGQFATLTFNEALLSQAIQNVAPQIPPPQPQPGRPAVNNVPRPPGGPVVQRPMPVPQIPTPPPHTRPTIRRKTLPQGIQQQQLQQQQSQQIQDDDLDLDTP